MTTVSDDVHLLFCLLKKGYSTVSTWFTYIVECADQTLYTGITTDLEKRIATHNKGQGSKYTRTRLPVRIVWSQAQENESAARKLELAIKRLTKIQKERFIYGN